MPPALAELAPPHHPAGRLNPQRVIVEALAERVYAARAWKPVNRQQRVERVDMDVDGAAMPIETLFSVLFEASGGRVASADRAPYEMVAAALLNPNVPVAGERAKTTATLFRQVLLSLLIGNGDLHLRNMAVLGTRRDGLALGPVYDPAPMRAWDEHDIVSACNLGGLELDRATRHPVWMKP